MDADDRPGTDVAPFEKRKKSMRMLDPFLVFVLTGLSIGVVAGVAVGWGTVCLLGSLRRSESSWPLIPRPSGPPRRGPGLVRCIHCKQTVCICDEDWAAP